jgi:hypothetical protein
MVQTAPLLHTETERLLSIGFDFRQSEDSGVVAMTTAGYLVGDIVNVQQRRLAANFGDKSTDPCIRTSSPSAVSSRSARLIVILL